MEKHNLSEHTPSEQEKQFEETLEARLNKDFPDPDARLSHAERAAVVSD